MKTMKPMPWTDDELRHCVVAYFAMLSKEIAGEKYSKAEANRALQQRINRSRGSIEMKWMNISAVLAEAGHSYIAGYKPYPNYQAALKTAVMVEVMNEEQRAAAWQRKLDGCVAS